MPRSEPDDFELARLLSGRAGLSVLEKERGLAGVVRAARPSRRRRLLGFGLVAAPALSGLLAVLAYHQTDEFTARGGKAATPHLRVLCARGEHLSDCAAGDTLVFEVAGAGAYDHVAVVGRDDSGTLVWYVPPPGGSSAPLAPGRRQMLRQGARIEAEQLRDDYVLHALFSTRPLAREALREALVDGPPGDASVRVVSRSLPRGERP